MCVYNNKHVYAYLHAFNELIVHEFNNVSLKSRRTSNNNPSANARHGKVPFELLVSEYKRFLQQYRLSPLPLVATKNLKGRPCCWKHRIKWTWGWRNWSGTKLWASPQMLSSSIIIRVVWRLTRENVLKSPVDLESFQTTIIIDPERYPNDRTLELLSFR